MNMVHTSKQSLAWMALAVALLIAQAIAANAASAAGKTAKAAPAKTTATPKPQDDLPPIFKFPTTFKLPDETFKRIPRQHPRLYFRAADFQKIKDQLGTTYAKDWAITKKMADIALTSGPAAYLAEPDKSGFEQLWQREVGNAMPFLAMAWKLTGQRKYLQSLEAWATASCSYPTWGLNVKGKSLQDGMDLAAAHQMLGLAVAYDWCLNDMSPATVALIKKTLIKRASAMYAAAVAKKLWWHSSFLQNHQWNSVMGMAAAGFAVAEDKPEASQWIGYTLDTARRAISCLGDDGASHEGEPYWEYGAEAILKFMVPAKELLGIDLFQHPWFKNNTLYALHTSLPRNAWTPKSSVLDIADSPRFHWYGPDYLLALYAKTYRDPLAQWLGLEMQKAGTANPTAAWLNFAFRDPALRPAFSRDIVAPSHHFEDMGIVTARSSWSGDESLLAFKCGPYIGHKALQIATPKQDLGGGHVHPDANHFILFGAGEMQLCDDGYAFKSTGNHNTLLVDGNGQMGEGNMWFSHVEPQAAHAAPHFKKVAFAPQMDYMAGDAAQAYPAASGVKSFTRHLYFVKPNALIVVDDIELAAPKKLELRFFPESETFYASGRGNYIFPGIKSLLCFTSLDRQGAELKIEPVARKNRKGDDLQKLAIQLSASERTKWRNICDFTWETAGKQPERITLLENNERLKIAIGEKILIAMPANLEAALH